MKCIFLGMHFCICFIVLSLSIYESISPTILCDVCGERLGKEESRKKGRKEGKDEGGRGKKESVWERDKEGISGEIQFCF